VDKQETQKIYVAIEAAYRRGFQHGHLAASGKLGAPSPSEDEVMKWRFSNDCTEFREIPPGTVNAGLKTNLGDKI